METLKQTVLQPDTLHYEVDPSSAEHANYAILRPPNAEQIQEDAADYVKELDLKGTHDVPFGFDVTVDQAITDPSELFQEFDDMPEAFKNITSYCAEVAKSLGFDGRAELFVGLQSDKHSGNLNPNATAHKDGIGATNYSAFEDGKSVKSVRFVYPIGRQGTIVFPGLQNTGEPGRSKFTESDGYHVALLEQPSEADRVAYSKFLTDSTGAITQPSLDSGIQAMPGNILVFDMTNSPWHMAPEATVDGAVFTVDVSQHEPLAEVA